MMQASAVHEHREELVKNKEVKNQNSFALELFRPTVSNIDYLSTLCVSWMRDPETYRLYICEQRNHGESSDGTSCALDPSDAWY